MTNEPNPNDQNMVQPDLVIGAWSLVLLYLILAYSMQAGHLPKGEVARKRLSTISSV